MTEIDFVLRQKGLQSKMFFSTYARNTTYFNIIIHQMHQTCFIPFTIYII